MAVKFLSLRIKCASVVSDSTAQRVRTVLTILPPGQVQCQRFGMKGMGDEFKDITTPQEWKIHSMDAERMTKAMTRGHENAKKYGKYKVITKIPAFAYWTLAGYLRAFPQSL